MDNNKPKNYSELATLINNKMRCADLKKLLFDTKEVEDCDLQYIGVMERIVEVAYFLIYLKLSKVKNRLNKSELSENALNAVNLLDRIYADQRLGLDAMIYILTEASRDVKLVGEKSVFAEILADSECSYARIYDMIYDWTNQFDFCESNLTVIFDNLVALLESVNYFENVYLSTLPSGGFVFEFGNKSYDARDYFCKIENEGYFLLESYSLLSAESVDCEYFRFGNMKQKFNCIKIKEERL